MILRQGLLLGVSGAAVGLGIGILASRAIGSMFILSFGGTSPMLFALILCPLLLIALVASYIPARRGSRIDPMRALREE